MSTYKGPTEARREACRKWRHKHPEKQKAACDRWRKNNPEKAEALKVRSRPRRALMRRARSFGLPVEEIVAFLAAHNGCSICGGPAEHIDHDHKTGVLRGMLCQQCNRGIGMFRDDPTILDRAADYLRQHRRKSSCIGAAQG